jgi:surface polysaccharide O-acyltransferase-like enzyme
MIMRVNRDLFFDAFRGIAIIAVVAIHSIYLGGNPDGRGFLYYRQFLNFSVPALFFMSGYWASKKPIESFNDYKVFLRGRFFRIGIPYLFWSLILLGYSALKKGDFNWFEITFKLLVGGASMGYYFIIAIAQLYIITPLLQYMNGRLNRYGLILIFVFNLAVIFALYLSRLFHVIWHLPAALPFYSWIIYYEFGLFMGERYSRISASSKMRVCIVFAILASFLISVFEVSILLSRYNRPDFAASAVKYSSVLYSVFVILGFLFWKEYFRRSPRVLLAIGRYSFGIYMIHIIILGWVVQFFQGFEVISGFAPVYQLTLVAVTTGLCLALIFTARKLLPESFCVKVLGF